MITFAPGPSQITNTTMDAIAEIAVSGFLSCSHRSQRFKDVCQQAIEGLRSVFGIPDEYAVVFQPSATAAMELVLRNCVSTRSSHFVHGAFSKRFFETACEMRIRAQALESRAVEAVPWRDFIIANDADTICVTHNETSTGLMWPSHELAELRKKFSQQILAVDITSSWGGVACDWRMADFWFASVQKCFGMPAGLAIVVLSPKALSVAASTQRGVPWNPVGWQNLTQLVDQMTKFQTPETPNMLAIALLARILSTWDAEKVCKNTSDKGQLIYRPQSFWQPFIEDTDWRSKTVAHFHTDQAEKLKSRALQAGYQLGNGYGPYKSNGIRVANFPALDIDDVASLLRVLAGRT